jgi:DNA-binding MurR/RpiR family transcriptional regulator
VPTTIVPPDSESALLQAIGQQFDGLSRQLKLIARHVEGHRSQLGLQSIQEVAAHCEVQPSAVVRFAKHFGFDGFTGMQKLFRVGLAEKVAPARSYQSRIRQAIESGTRKHSSADIAQALVGGSIASLQELQGSLDAAALEASVGLLAKSSTIWLMATRRAYPVSAYLAYALQHTEKRIQHINAIGSMQDGQLRGLVARDVLIAVSFAPYADETRSIVQQAQSRGASIIVITDSQLSPLQAYAALTLVVQETSVFGFRALTNSMALAQSLFLALAYRLELDYQPTRIPTRTPNPPSIRKTARKTS